ncbi:MAG: diguanylate cyclase domain-containing protein [bacterium]
MKKASKPTYQIIIVEKEAPLFQVVTDSLEQENSDFNVQIKRLSDIDKLIDLLQLHHKQGAVPAVVILNLTASDYKKLKPYENIRSLYPDIKLVCRTSKYDATSAVKAINQQLLDLYLDRKESRESFTDQVQQLLSAFHEKKSSDEKRISQQLLSEKLANENKKLSNMLTASEIISEFSSQINQLSQLDLDEVLDLIISRIPSLFKAEAISIFLYDEENEKYHLVRDNHIGISLDYHYGDLKNSPMQEALTTGIPVIVRNIKQSHLKFYNVKELGQSCIVIPFIGNSQKTNSWEETVSLDLKLTKITGVLNIAKINLDIGNEDVEPLTYKAALVQKVLSTNISRTQLYNIYRKANEHRITDELTGLYNERMFNNLLKMEFERGKRFRNNFSVVFAQMDGYPEITGKYGKEIGNKLLKELSTFLRNNIRRSDLLAYRETSDFMIILPSTNSEQALLLLENFKAMLNNIRFTKHEIFVKMYYGVTISRFPKVESVETIYNRCQAALAEANKKGAGSIAVKPD